MAERIAARPDRSRAESRHGALLVSLFIVLSLGAGCSLYSLPLFLQHLTKDRGLSLNGVSFAATVYFICGALVALPTGRLLLRVQPRTVMLFGAVLGAMSLALLGRAHELWEVCACYGVLGASFSGGGALPASTAVLRVSSRASRARMLAMSTAGVSSGGFLVTPIVSVLVSAEGFATGLLIMGLIYAAIAVAALAIIMPAISSSTAPPVDAAAASSREPDESVRPANQDRELTRRAALRTSTFWVLAGCLVLYYAAQIGSSNHIIRMASDRGLANDGLLLPVITLFAVLGRLVGSIALRRYAIWTVLIGVIAIELSATVGLAFTDSTTTLFASAILLGIALGHMPVVLPITLAEAFGVSDYPRIAATFTLLTSLGTGGGPVLVSLVHNAVHGPWGAYRAGYLSLTASATVGCALAIVLSRRFARTTAITASSTAV